MHERLPILTFDEQAIRPQLGYWFDCRWIDPWESLVTILWKFARANAIPGQVLAHRLCGDQTDPYEGVVPLRETVDWRWLQREYRIRRNVIRESLVSESRRYALHPDLHWCRRCLRRGYLATIFQLAGVSGCPIHRNPLDGKCPYCDFRIPLRLNALLLGSPFACPACRGRLAGNTPIPHRHKPMAMPDLIRITRRRQALHLA